MKKRKNLGQHFLKSKTIAKSIASAAEITKNDVVLEIGTGYGILVPYLCNKAKQVFSIEADRNLYVLAQSKSRFAIEWLLQKKFSAAVIMVQKEFANKLVSRDDHKAVAVLANYGFKIRFLMNVKKSNFFPPPKVDSTVLILKQKKPLSKVLISTVYHIFSYRRKTIQNILKQFNINSTSKRRLDDLTGDEIIKIAKKIIRN